MFSRFEVRILRIALALAPPASDEIEFKSSDIVMLLSSDGLLILCINYNKHKRYCQLQVFQRNIL